MTREPSPFAEEDCAVDEDGVIVRVTPALVRVFEILDEIPDGDDDEEELAPAGGAARVSLLDRSCEETNGR